MENKLVDGTVDEKIEKRRLPYQLIKKITNDFDDERILGSGTFGTVYKGVFENGEDIAVKVLHNSISGLDGEEFRKEFQILRELKHQNVVELVGFCNEPEEVLVEHEGKQVVAIEMHRALCFEYVHNGSLHTYISEVYTGLNWHTRYKIIKGICEGLKYLRGGLKSSIWHLDLKPDNILLNNKMIPKIADFGLSRLLREEKTRKTLNCFGTRGYWASEFINHQVISEYSDIFSLGVIIVKIMIGSEGYTRIADMTTRKFVNHVHESWRGKLNGIAKPRSLEVYCNQVKRCIEIALQCLKPNRQERPTIENIVSSLNETESMIGDRGLQIEQEQQPMEQKLANTLDNFDHMIHGQAANRKKNE
uniref:Cysteine-rich receptor-like protein kinase 40 n=1 Tax=Aegilops tauschii TaxID=37682 RepID=R7WF61_AEGTA